MFGCVIKNLGFPRKKFIYYAVNIKFYRAKQIFLLSHLVDVTEQFDRGNKFVLYSYGGIASCLDISEEVLNRNPPLRIFSGQQNY